MARTQKLCFAYRTQERKNACFSFLSDFLEVYSVMFISEEQTSDNLLKKWVIYYVRLFLADHVILGVKLAGR